MEQKRNDLNRKKAVFFSLDALLALTIILMSLMIIFPTIKYSQYETSIPQDIITVLSTLKTGEIDNQYVKELISQGKITNLDKTIIEQIGEFYITNLTIAKNLGDAVLSEIETNENIGIWYGNKLIASKNTTSYSQSDYVEIERQIISGISNGTGVTGFSSRVYLSRSTPKKYSYFGGYVGDGNISIILTNGGEIDDLEIEIAINKDFDIYINDIFSGHYENSSSVFTPATYDLEAYVGNFNGEDNIIKIVGEGIYIAGGFMKIEYTNYTLYEQPTRYYFPGIKGAINLYDGFYIPGILNQMSVYLHYDSPYEIFLNIGNVAVFNDSNPTETTETIDNAELSSLLDYDFLSNKTIPLRLGMKNVTYITNATKEVDVFSVTDLSGSMCGSCPGANFWCCLFGGWCTNNQPACESCGGTCTGGIYETKDANNLFIDAILNNSGNRVGLVGYETDVQDFDCHDLSEDNESLKNKVSDWTAAGGTCICCGINKAVQKLNEDSDDSKNRVMVVMSDGMSNVECVEQGVTGDLDGDGNPDTASDDAIQAACDAYQVHGIIVHAVGFGSADEDALKDISDCGNGDYYYGDVDNIIEIYSQIATDIIDAFYSEQTIEVSSNISVTLYPDSYIEFNYTKEENPPGLILTAEEQFTDTYTGSFQLPENSTILETEVVSYSGPRWTDVVEINNLSVYNLSSYDSNYIELGDPYAISIPNGYVNESNSVKLTTGLSPLNSTEGSQSNKIIYTILREMTSYSTISALAEGCIWNIQFEDETETIIKSPVDYSGSNSCSYTSSNIEHDSNDAMQNSVYNLLKLIDFNSNNKIDVKFTSNDLVISSSEVTGIPYSWSTEVQIRRWN